VAKVLVVDDEKNVRTSLVIALRRNGHEVESVATGEEAVLSARTGDYDLVLTDLRLGDMNGMDVLRAVKSDHPETEVVMMTAYASIENAVEAMRLGAQNYLRKPFEADDVTRVVSQALEHRELVAEVAMLKGESRDRSAFAEILGTSPVLREVLDLVAKVADTESTVLVTGETGTGKELVGRAIHRASRRRQNAFVAINSAAFPETLLESELFGHRRGAFTGAAANKKGIFEHANQGTVFLDEVAEMPLSMQAKLLRFLQTGEIRPVGSESTRFVDVRLITATNKNLEREVAEGRFREDLYYRLAVIPVHLPPLRERPEDIPLLARHFLDRFSSRIAKRIEGIDPAAAELLKSYPWPGNVRELENTIERGVALCRGPRLLPEDFPERLRERKEEPRRDAIQSLQALERAHILTTLDKVGWNRKRAAELLQISTTTLWRRLKEFGIDGESALQGTKGGLHA
jgi:DNA-binding NtrC family response regulator